MRARNCDRAVLRCGFSLVADSCRKRPGMLRYIVLMSLVIVGSIFCLYGGRPVEGYSMDYLEYPQDLIYGVIANQSMIAKAKYLGITTVRVSAHWDLTVPEKDGEWDWSATDANIQSMLDAGFEVVVLITGTPYWASGISDTDLHWLQEEYEDGRFQELDGVFQPNIEYLQDFSTWIIALADRYKGKVKYYEYWNEPDGMGWPILERNREGKPVRLKYGGDPIVFVQFLRAAYIGIKSIDPYAQVAFGGLESKVQFLLDVYASGGGDYFDAVAVHPYGFYEGPEEALRYSFINGVREAMVINGDERKAIWVTEYGFVADIADPKSTANRVHKLREVLQYFSDTEYITIATLHHLFGKTRGKWDLAEPVYFAAFKAERARRQNE